MALIRVDGRPLLEIVRELEAHVAGKAGEIELAGKYDYLNSTTVCFPSRHLLGEAASELLKCGEKVSILECNCGCEGCWPLRIRITVTNDLVIWSEFEQPHRQNWVYPNDLRFVFDRSQYEAALRLA